MIRNKLIKIFAIGLCISAFSTGAAFAQTVAGGGVSSSNGTVSQEDNALFDKQSEIDQYIFKDHVKDIEKKGFQVVYTGVSEKFVEIGITPYSEDAANFLYDIFGKDEVKVVKGEEVLLYTTQIAPDAAVSSEAVDPVVPAAPDTAVAYDDGAKGAAANAASDAANDGRVYKGEGDQEMQIQIESLTGEESQLEDPSVIYQTTAGEATEEAADVAVVSAQDKAEIQDNSAKADALSAPVVILIIVAGAMVIGALVIIYGKRNTAK